MKPPEPGAAQAIFNIGLGEWVGEETLFPSPWDPAGGEARAELTRIQTLNGFGVIDVYRQTRADGAQFDGHAVLQHDAATGEYVMHWFDHMGHFPFRGSLSGLTLTMTHTMADAVMRAEYDFNGVPHAFGFAMDMSADGGQSWQPLMRTIYAAVKEGA